MNESDAKCAEVVIGWATDRLVRAETEHVKALCDEAGRAKSEKLWEELHPEDGVGGFSQNPYRKTFEDRVVRCSAEVDEARRIKDFVVSRVCRELSGLVEVAGDVPIVAKVGTHGSEVIQVTSGIIRVGSPISFVRLSGEKCQGRVTMVNEAAIFIELV